MNIHKSGLESIIIDKQVSLMPKAHLINKSKEEVQDISSTTLDYLLEKHNINFVDILIVDVEGFEINLLDGLTNKIKINYILIETFDENTIINYCKKRNWDLVEKFTHKDYLFKVS